MATEKPTEQIDNKEVTEQPVTPAAAQKSDTEQATQTVSFERFEQVNKRMKEAEKLLAEREKAAKDSEAAKLVETQQFEALYKSEQTKAAALEKRLNDMVAAEKKRTITSAIETEARKAGFADPADAHVFMDIDGIEVDESGKVKGVESLVKELAKNKPYLLAAPNPAKGNGQNPNAAGVAGGAAKTEQAKRDFERAVRAF